MPRRFGTCDDQSTDGARGRDAGPDGGADPDPCSRHRQPDANADRNGYRDTRADDGSDEHAGAQSNTHPSHTHADPNGHSDTDADADSRSDQYANADPDTCAAYTHADGDRHGDAHAYAFEHSHAYQYTYADSGTDSGR